MLRQLSTRSLARMTQVRGYSVLPELTFPASLPALKFDYKQGVAPVLSGRQMELHFTKHHKAYVDKLNALGAGFEGKSVEEIVLLTHTDESKKVMFNQAAQHFNHSFFWQCLTPNGTPMPGQLKAGITRDFGSVEAFTAQFEAAGAGNFGSGWTWLCVDPKKACLVIDNTSNAGCPLTKGLRPVFTADVWEHAYYKDFENRRPDYLKELWKIVNWEFVGRAYSRAIVA